jgi:hypothetical protein
MPPMPTGDVMFFAQMVAGVPKPMAAVTSNIAYDLEIGTTVLWEVENKSHGDHPFHTHGFPFQWYEVEYIDAETPENNYKEFPTDNGGVIEKTPENNYKEFPTDNGGVIESKDTVLVPARPGNFGLSSTIMRAVMKIDDTGREGRITAAGGNPSSEHSGGWLYHCHILEHAARGMMSFFEVRDPADPFQNIGGGSKSPDGVNSYLKGTGTVQAGGAISIDLTEATPARLTYLVVGFSEIYVPKQGAEWVPSPDLILGPVLTDGLGEVTIPAHWPTVPIGASVALQYWTKETPDILSASNALRITQL